VTWETKQPITLEIDSGYVFIRFSVITNKEELMSGKVKLRNNISKKLTKANNVYKTKKK